MYSKCSNTHIINRNEMNTKEMLKTPISIWKIKVYSLQRGLDSNQREI